MPSGLPTVLVPVFNSAAGLDACLASLERTLPAGTSVMIVDDASTDPHVESLARSWCHRSKLAARYLPRPQHLGFAASVAEALAELDDVDVVLLRTEALATPGWLERLVRHAAANPKSATFATWSNRTELCAFPLFGEDNPSPEFPESIAEAAAGVAWGEVPELATALGPCMFLRRAALRQLGGIDASSFASERALDDLCLRAAAMGWTNTFCPAVFIVGGERATDMEEGCDDLSRLLGRWPDYSEQVARFFLADPLRPLRESLQARIDMLARSGPQRDLFN